MKTALLAAFVLTQAGCAVVCCGNGTATATSTTVRAGGEVKDIGESISEVIKERPNAK